jgi:hypothetical protein
VARNLASKLSGGQPSTPLPFVHASHRCPFHRTHRSPHSNTSPSNKNNSVARTIFDLFLTHLRTFLSRTHTAKTRQSRGGNLLQCFQRSPRFGRHATRGHVLKARLLAALPIKMITKRIFPTHEPRYLYKTVSDDSHCVRNPYLRPLYLSVRLDRLV